MKMDGKILFFNETDGVGIIITSQRKKVEFDIADWDDYDVMPTTGLEVVFEIIDVQACNIVAKENEASFQGDTDAQEVIEKQEIIEEENEVPQKIDDIAYVEEDETDKEEDTQTIEQEQNRAKHFEQDKNIDILEDNEELLEKERPESITNTLTLSKAITNYFNIIQANIKSRKAYKKVDGRLDYRVVRRFIWTTYNNLADIDIEIVTPKIKYLKDDLIKMSSVYDDFIRKTKYPKLAYAEVFLSVQAEYMNIKLGAQKIIEKLNRLRIDEKKIGGIKKVKKQELEENIHSEHFTILEEEMKSLNGAYVDVVHMMAELDERYKSDLQLLDEFEKEYREDFYKLFAIEEKKYKYDLVDILNAQAYIFDLQLWHRAKQSKGVKAYFKKSSISGELNTKTYLKYYLNTQDSQKASQETKKLFELYDYLISIHKDYILIMVASAQDAMDYESAIKSIDKEYHVKSFVDEIQAIKWAMKNSIKLLVVEEQLSRVRVEKFLTLYTKNVLSTPKIVLIGEKPKSTVSAISKLLSTGTSSRIIAQNVKSVMDELI